MRSRRRGDSLCSGAVPPTRGRMCRQGTPPRNDRLLRAAPRCGQDHQGSTPLRQACARPSLLPTPTRDPDAPLDNIEASVSDIRLSCLRHSGGWRWATHPMSIRSCSPNGARIGAGGAFALRLDAPHPHGSEGTRGSLLGPAIATASHNATRRKRRPSSSMSRSVIAAPKSWPAMHGRSSRQRSSSSASSSARAPPSAPPGRNRSRPELRHLAHTRSRPWTHGCPGCRGRAAPCVRVSDR
jgi:hypothetical protein